MNTLFNICMEYIINNNVIFSNYKIPIEVKQKMIYNEIKINCQNIVTKRIEEINSTIDDDYKNLYIIDGTINKININKQCIKNIIKEYEESYQKDFSQQFFPKADYIYKIIYNQLFPRLDYILFYLKQEANYFEKYHHISNTKIF